MTYTVRFAVDRIQTAVAGWTPVFTVPADTNAYVLRDIVLWNELSTPSLIVAGLHSGTLDLWILGSSTFAGQSTMHWDGRQVLHAGEVLELFLAANSSAGVMFTGYSLLN